MPRVKFVVSVYVPSGVSIPEMREYISGAVGNWSGGLHPDDDMFLIGDKPIRVWTLERYRFWIKQLFRKKDKDEPMGRSKCPHCGEKIAIRHTVRKSSWIDGRGTSPSSHPTTVNHKEIYEFFLDGHSAPALSEKYGITKRQVHHIVREQERLDDEHSKSVSNTRDSSGGDGDRVPGERINTSPDSSGVDNATKF